MLRVAAIVANSLVILGTLLLVSELGLPSRNDEILISLVVIAVPTLSIVALLHAKKERPESET